ncbi:MAG: glycosyltransferase, partial [Alphaproteobacteria bacterium]|nr:glycosyltransferase [Alphaproteobacteria bacterium]
MIAVAHLITGLDSGGAQRMLAQLAARFDRARFRTIVISMTDSGATGREIAESGIPVVALGMRRGVPDPLAVYRIGRVLSEFRPDVLQTWLYHADLLGLVAAQLGFAPRLVWNIRCTEVLGGTRLPRLLAWCSGRPDVVIANAAAGRCFHARLGYRPRRWVLLPNGFDTEALRPDPAERARHRAALGWDASAIAIALPARYHPMKDHATFLAAAARLAQRRPEVRFVLAGSGADGANPQLTALVRESGAGAAVMLLGERRDLDRLYPAFDIVTLSSAYGEGFPNVLGEAMSRGVPCVATDVGDCAEILGDTGETVPARDPAALAAAWERLALLEPEQRAAR